MTFVELRRLCLSLPDAEERETWGEATFRVGDRIFAMGSPDGDLVSIKASLDDQSGLIAMDPKTFAASAYTGRYGWVSVRLRTVGPELMTRIVTAAWKRTAPKRAVARYEAESSGATSRTGDGTRRVRTGARPGAGSPRRQTQSPSR